MFKILNRYLFRQLFVSTLFIATILTGTLWLTQSLRFVDVVISRGFSLITLFKMVLFLAPDLMGLILPMATLIALLFTYHRLLMDSELVVMRTAGMSNFSLAKPAFINAGFILSFLYILNLYLVPLSLQQFKNLEHYIRHQAVSSLIQPGEFTTFKSMTVYARERRRAGYLKGILIHNAQDKQHIFTLTAEEGFVSETSQGIRITLMKGNRQHIDPQSRKPNILFFDAYTVDLSMPTVMQRPRKPYERSWSDLINPDLAQENPKTLRRLSIEFHQRLILPLTVLCFTATALALFLRGEYNRRDRIKRVSMIIVLCGLLELGLMSLINLAERWPVAIFMAYGIIALNLSVALVGIYEPLRSLKFKRT